MYTMKTAVSVFSGLMLLCGASFGSILCPSGTYDTYLGSINAGGGCSISTVQFSNFGYSGTATGGALALPASSISVAPVSAPEIGFIFTLPLSAGSNQGADVAFSYTAKNTAGFTGASLFQTAMAGGAGTAGAADTLCLGGSLLGGCQGGSSVTLQTINGSGFSQPVDHVSFSRVTSVDVSKDVGANSNGAGTASISVVGNTLATGQVPEPISMVLIGSGLLALGLVRRRA